MLFVKEHHAREREAVMTRLRDIQAQYDELVKHRADVDKGIQILESEFYRIEGELRMLEAMANAERELQMGMKTNKK